MLSLKNNLYCSRNSKNKNMTYGIVGLGRSGSSVRHWPWIWLQPEQRSL